MEDTNTQRRERWRIGKEIPITFIIVIALQTFGVAVWFGIVWNKIMEQGRTIDELRAERYTKDEARRDRELFELRTIAAAQLALQRFDALDARLDRIQTSMERHTEREVGAGAATSGAGSVRRRWSGEGDSNR